MSMQLELPLCPSLLRDRGSFNTENVGSGSLTKSPGMRGFRMHRGKSNFTLEQYRDSLRQITNHKTKKEESKGSLRKLVSFATNMSLEAPRLLDIDEKSNCMGEELEIDIEEQRGLTQQCEEQKTASERKKNRMNANRILDWTGRNDTSAEPTNNHDMVDLTPGVQLPLRNSAVTWQAILEGVYRGYSVLLLLMQIVGFSAALIRVFFFWLAVRSTVATMEYT
jgi:hypothetical protein